MCCSRSSRVGLVNQNSILRSVEERCKCRLLDLLHNRLRCARKSPGSWFKQLCHQARATRIEQITRSVGRASTPLEQQTVFLAIQAGEVNRGIRWVRPTNIQEVLAVRQEYRVEHERIFRRVSRNHQSRIAPGGWHSTDPIRVYKKERSVLTPGRAANSFAQGHWWPSAGQNGCQLAAHHKPDLFAVRRPKGSASLFRARNHLRRGTVEWTHPKRTVRTPTS